MRLNISRRIAVLMIAGFWAVQALAVVHAFEHPLPGHANHACIICAHGQAADNMLLPVTGVPLPWRHTPAPAVTPAARAEQPAPGPKRIRDPPLHSC